MLTRPCRWRRRCNPGVPATPDTGAASTSRSPRPTALTSTRPGGNSPRRNGTCSLRHRYGAPHDPDQSRAGRQRSYQVKFEGLVSNLERRFRNRTPKRFGEDRGLHGRAACPSCHGARLRPEASRSRSGVSIRDFTDMSATAAREWIGTWISLPPNGDRPADRARVEERLSFPGQRGDRLPLSGPGPPGPFPAGRPSGSGWRPRSAPAWSASCTYWTNPRSASINGTTKADRDPGKAP